MLQVVLKEPGEFLAHEVPEPSIGEGEALVRIKKIGVCGTDLHAFAGRQPFFRYPRVLGHELGVEVLELAAGVANVAVGDKCAIEPYLSCGNCHACRQGKTNCCESLEVLGVHCDGGMQPLFTVPAHLLHTSRELSLDQLALVETLGIGAHAVDRGKVQSGERVLVVGAGPIGLAVLQFAVATGADVRVLDVSESRREFVSRLGVTAIESTSGELFDVVFDATGNAKAMEASFEHVHHGGRLVLVGIVTDRISFDDPLFHRREMTLLSSRNSAGIFPKIIHMIEQGEIDTAPWITDRLALGDVPQAFASLRARPQLVKAMIEVE